MFSFDASFLITSKPENLLAMRSDEASRNEEYAAGCIVSNPFAGRTEHLVTT
jgi:hypothetical protein